MAGFLLWYSFGRLPMVPSAFLRFGVLYCIVVLDSVIDFLGVRFFDNDNELWVLIDGDSFFCYDSSLGNEIILSPASGRHVLPSTSPPFCSIFFTIKVNIVPRANHQYSQ